MKKVLIIGTILMMSGMVMGQNYGVIGMPGGTLQGGELDSVKVALLHYEEADGVDSDNKTTFWKARKVTTEDYDGIGVTIVGDTAISVPEGQYLIMADYITSATALRIYDQTSATVLSTGSFIGGGFSNAQVSGHYSGGAATLKIEAISGTGGSPHFSAQATVSPEIYGRITIMKLN